MDGKQHVRVICIFATFVVMMVIFWFIDTVSYCRWIRNFLNSMLPSYSEFHLNMKDVGISTTLLVKIVFVLVVILNSHVLQMDINITEEFIRSVFRVNPEKEGSMFQTRLYPRAAQHGVTVLETGI
jgi:hypothetical protein